MSSDEERTTSPVELPAAACVPPPPRDAPREDVDAGVVNSDVEVSKTPPQAQDGGITKAAAAAVADGDDDQPRVADAAAVGPDVPVPSVAPETQQEIARRSTQQTTAPNALLGRITDRLKARLVPTLSQKWKDDVADMTPSVVEVAAALGSASLTAETVERELLAQALRVVRWRLSPQGSALATLYNEGAMSTLVCAAALVRGPVPLGGSALEAAYKRAVASLDEAAAVSMPLDDEHQWFVTVAEETYGDITPQAAREPQPVPRARWLAIVHAALAAAYGCSPIPRVEVPLNYNVASSMKRPELVEARQAAKAKRHGGDTGHQQPPQQQLSMQQERRQQPQPQEQQQQQRERGGVPRLEPPSATPVDPCVQHLSKAPLDRHPNIPVFVARDSMARYGIPEEDLRSILPRLRGDIATSLMVHWTRAFHGINDAASVSHVTGLREPVCAELLAGNKTNARVILFERDPDPLPSQVSPDIPASWDITRRVVCSIDIQAADSRDRPYRAYVICSLVGMPIFVTNAHPIDEAAQDFASMLRNGSLAQLLGGHELIIAPPEFAGTTGMMVPPPPHDRSEQADTQRRFLEILTRRAQHSVAKIQALPAFGKRSNRFTPLAHQALLRSAIMMQTDYVRRELSIVGGGARGAPPGGNGAAAGGSGGEYGHSAGIGHKDDTRGRREREDFQHRRQRYRNFASEHGRRGSAADAL